MIIDDFFFQFQNLQLLKLQHWCYSEADTSAPPATTAVTASAEAVAMWLLFQLPGQTTQGL